MIIPGRRWVESHRSFQCVIQVRMQLCKINAYKQGRACDCKWYDSELCVSRCTRCSWCNTHCGSTEQSVSTEFGNAVVQSKTYIVKPSYVHGLRDAREEVWGLLGHSADATSNARWSGASSFNLYSTLRIWLLHTLRRQCVALVCRQPWCWQLKRQTIRSVSNLEAPLTMPVFFWGTPPESLPVG